MIVCINNKKIEPNKGKKQVKNRFINNLNNKENEK